MVTLLQKYIAIKSAYPEPDYQSVVGLFKEQALKDGFEVQEIILPSEYPVLVITLQGTDPALPALALNHHMDVVPADNVDEWKFPPFVGIVHEDHIYGRGTQDCKGLGVVQYAALLKLKQSGIQPIRTIHCIMVPDEERGGYQGTKEFLEHPAFQALNIGYVLDEGMPSGNDQELLLKVDERTPIQIRVTSSGSQSHASSLMHENCVHTLTQFLASVAQFQAEQQQRITFKHAGNLMSMHVTSLMTHNTALNVIPAKAYATIDIRIPSHMSFDEGIAIIHDLLNHHANITYEIIATSKERFKAVKHDTHFYQLLARSVADNGFTPKPFAFEATTDARFYSHRGIEAIGFTPFSITPNLHGTDECIRLKDFELGIDIIYSFLRAFCMLNDKKVIRIE